MRVDINGARKRLHQMKCPEADRIGHLPTFDIPFEVCG